MYNAYIALLNNRLGKKKTKHAFMLKIIGIWKVMIFCNFIIPSPYFDEIRNIFTLKHNLNQIFIHTF